MQVTEGWKSAVTKLMAFPTAETEDIAKLASLAGTEPANLLVVTGGVFFSRGCMDGAEAFYARAARLDTSYEFLLDFFKAQKLASFGDEANIAEALQLLREIEQRRGVQAKAAGALAEQLLARVERDSAKARVGGKE